MAERLRVDKVLKLDLETLPTKYIALCEFTAKLMHSDALEVDEQVEEFIKDTNFETFVFQSEEVNPQEIIEYMIAECDDWNRQLWKKKLNG